ncbi:MAG: alpha/beta hydrolase [Luteolibacter sp.]
MKNRVVSITLLGVTLFAIIAYGYFTKNRKSSSPTPPKNNVSSLPTGTKALELSTLDTVVIPEIPNRPKGERVKVNGINLYYEVFGEGEPLLLLHGGGATIESWFAQIPDFAKKYKVIVPDSRGHGRSQDGEGPINFDLMASDMVALLDHLGIKSAMVVGWSDGGVIGLQMAVRHPGLVKKLVTLGAHSRPAGMTDEFKSQVESFDPESFPTILKDGYKALSPDGPEHWPLVFGKLKIMWLTLPDFQESELKGILCPVLLLVGEHDIVRKEESERISRLIPNSKLEVIMGASHYSPVEVPEKVNQIIIGFLEIP